MKIIIYKSNFPLRRLVYKDYICYANWIMKLSFFVNEVRAELHRPPGRSGVYILLKTFLSDQLYPLLHP